MESTFYFLVEVIEDYNNYTTLSNGLQIMVNNTIDSVEHINRIGRIISAPKGVKADIGDEVMFHHNITRRSYGPKGKKGIGAFQVKPTVFFIPVPEIFMMRKPDSEWIPLDPYIFIEPMEAENITYTNGLQVLEDAYKDKKEFIGRIAFNNNSLKSAGVEVGDLIGFQEYSQHEYVINNKLYYKMQTNDILVVY